MAEEEDRSACLDIDPKGFTVRHPPPQNELDTFYTPDEQVFQTIHMGAAVVDPERWTLEVSGEVEKPFRVNLEQLLELPQTTITAFHECFGSPIKPAIHNVWRIGNVQWTGVPLKVLLDKARPSPDAQYVWSDGLDYGAFNGVEADRYQKDLPIEKAMSAEVLVAFRINGQPLSKRRGGPVRLVVPGWFGTNSTKWLFRLSLQRCRSNNPFCTTFYNTMDNETGEMKPVWAISPNSMIVRPSHKGIVSGQDIDIQGWCWSHDGIQSVDIETDQDQVVRAQVEQRTDFSWQKFAATLHLPPGEFDIRAYATSKAGVRQPTEGQRNHAHRISITVTA